MEEKEDSDDDINPPLFDPEVALEIQISDLDVESVESVTPDTPATSTTPSGDDIRKENLGIPTGGRRVIKVRYVVAQIITMHCSVTLT